MNYSTMTTPTKGSLPRDLALTNDIVSVLYNSKKARLIDLYAFMLDEYHAEHDDERNLDSFSEAVAYLEEKGYIQSFTSINAFTGTEVTYAVLTEAGVKLYESQSEVIKKRIAKQHDNIGKKLAPEERLLNAIYSCVDSCNSEPVEENEQNNTEIAVDVDSILEQIFSAVLECSQADKKPKEPVKKAEYSKEQINYVLAEISKKCSLLQLECQDLMMKQNATAEDYVAVVNSFKNVSSAELQLENMIR